MAAIIAYSLCRDAFISARCALSIYGMAFDVCNMRMATLQSTAFFNATDR